MILGLSTGCLYKNIEPTSKEAINAIKSTNCNAIELCAGSKKRIFELESISNSDLESFDYVSLHAPDDIIFDNSFEAKKILEEIARQHKRLDFDSVIVHGDNIVSGEIFQKYHLPIAIENHDTRFGRTVEEMEEIFKRFYANMVLDVLHSYIAGKLIFDDPATLTYLMQDKFKNRIVQAHLSGLGVHDDSQQHYPINIMKQIDILDSVPKDVPIIIESVFPKYSTIDRLLKELRAEYSYVRDYMSNRK